MATNDQMPDASAVGLQEARCRRIECRSLLARLRLDGNSLVEIKCRRCQAVSTFAPDTSKVKLKADGQGGYVHVPVGDN